MDSARRPHTTGALGAVGLSVVAVGTTAPVAAPVHRRLGYARTTAGLRLLLRADRLRCVVAVLAAITAVTD